MMRNTMLHNKNLLLNPCYQWIRWSKVSKQKFIPRMPNSI